MTPSVASFIDTLSRVKGCTFASLDAETTPCPGVIRRAKGEGVILFTNRGGSGYEAMVRRRLIEAGKDPDSFVLSDLPWGERVPNTPVITHKGRHYVQTILIRPGDTHCFIGRQEVDCAVFIKRTDNQGLGDRAVIVQTYDLENITRLTLLGNTISRLI